MRYQFLLIILLLSFAANAQITTNINWTEKTQMPASQVIYYNPSQKLQWPDFKGEPTTTGIVAAITMSGFGYTASMKRNGNKGEINIGVYCYFSKEKSWVKPGKTTVYILNHEQHHFDISYIAASIFVSRLRNTDITTGNINSVLPKIYKECCDIMNKMQDDYDGQTKNGQLKDIQEKWNIQLNDKLSEFTK
jgi:hypothetical protein